MIFKTLAQELFTNTFSTSSGAVLASSTVIFCANTIVVKQQIKVKNKIDFTDLIASQRYYKSLFFNNRLKFDAFALCHQISVFDTAKTFIEAMNSEYCF